MGASAGIVEPAHRIGTGLVANDLAGEELCGIPSEDEMLVHFVIPLFRGLGWPQELLAVKWNYMDLVVFRKLPRIPENCSLVVEAKRLGVGAESALQQAIDYSNKLPNPRDVLLTDGFRYRLYEAKVDFQPVEYANLLALKMSAAELMESLRYVRTRKPFSWSQKFEF